MQAGGAESVKRECRSSDRTGRKTEWGEMFHWVNGMGFFGRIVHARTLPKAG